MQTSKDSLRRRRDMLGLLVVLVVAAALRLGWPGVNSFAFDEARLSLISLRMARGGMFASVGMPSSAGVPNLPAAAWIFAIPYALSPDPLVATIFVALVSVLAVGLLWVLVRRAWGSGAALAAGLYFAASPYGVLYSRSVWAQDLLPVLAVVWAASAYASIVGRRRWALALHAFAAGFAFQVHFAGAALGLASVYLFFRFRWWRTLLPVVIGGGLAFAALIPFVLHLAVQPAVADQFRAAFGQPSHIDLSALQELVRLALAIDWRYLTIGTLAPGDVQWWLVIPAAVLLVAGLASVVRWAVFPHPQPLSPRERGVTDLVGPESGQSDRETRLLDGSERDIANAHHYEHNAPLPPGEGESGSVSFDRPKPERSGDREEGVRALSELALVMLVAPLVLFLRHGTPVFIHYLLVALPALALLAGASVRLVSRHVWAVGAVVLMAALALAWTAQIAAIMPIAAAAETPNGLGTPLNRVRDAAYGLPGDAPVVFFTHGDDPNVDGEAAVFEALWWNRPHRIVQGESLLILPSAPSVLMATLAPFQAWEELTAAGLAVSPLTFPRRTGAEPFVAVTYDGETAPSGFTLLDAPVTFDDGARLEGWRVRRVGPRLRVDTLWTVLSLPPAGTYQQFHHLQTAQTLDNGLFKGADVPLSANRWQIGDRLIVIGDFFDVDAGQYWVDIGHYTLPDVARVRRADGGDNVRLGPFTAPGP